GFTRLIESRALELTTGSASVTGRVENKRGIRAETSSTNQQARSLQPSLVFYLMTKLLTHKTRK
ncbi:unnamed protein product, partial [Hymenolepis diminuta]